MIRWLLQGAWNLGHRARYQKLEDRVERLEYWVRVHAPLIDPKAVKYDERMQTIGNTQPFDSEFKGR